MQNNKIKELINAAQEIISNLEDADETTDEAGKEFADTTRLKKAITEMNGEEVSDETKLLPQVAEMDKTYIRPL